MFSTVNSSTHLMHTAQMLSYLLYPFWFCCIFIVSFAVICDSAGYFFGIVFWEAVPPASGGKATSLSSPNLNFSPAFCNLAFTSSSEPLTGLCRMLFACFWFGLSILWVSAMG
jgi:hypothetical protein